MQRFCVATGGKTAFFFNLSPVSSDLPDAQYSSVCFVVDTKHTTTTTMPTDDSEDDVNISDRKGFGSNTFQTPTAIYPLPVA